MRNRPDYANEDWIVLLTTDYGGIGITHGTNTAQERMIWWIGAGNRTGSHQPPSNEDPGSVAMQNYDPVKGAKNPAQYDIAVTALDHLLKESSCTPTINPDWKLDGKSWLDSIHTEIPNGIFARDRQSLQVKVFPNPSSGTVSFWFENDQQQQVTFRIMNQQGQEIRAIENTSLINANKLNVDLSHEPAGVYYVELTIGAGKTVKKIIHQ